MGGFDQTRINALAPTAVAGFKADQLSAIDTNAMAGFGKDQVAGLAPTAMAGLAADQVSAIDDTAIAGLGKDQLGGLAPKAMAGFDQTKITALDAAAMGGLKKDQVAELAPTAMGGFKKDQVANLDAAAVGGFKKDQVAAIDPTAMAGFKSDQVAGLDPTAMAGFKPDQLKAIDPDAVAGLKEDQVKNLSKDAVGGLTSNQFDKLPDDALKGLTKDNLGGLGTDVVQGFSNDTIAKLDPTQVKSLAGDDFSKLMTNVDPTKVTADAVDDLLPTGWELDSATGDLKAPPGASLSFKTIDKAASDNINETSLPPLPDLSKDLALGGGTGDGSGGVLAGLDKALDAVAGDGAFKFEQRSDGILNLKTAGSDDAAAAFIPDTSKMKQAPDGTAPGVSQDATGAYVLTTDKGYQIPLLPSLADPDAVKNQLPADSKIEVGTGGQTTISDLGVDGSDKPVVGMPSPLLVASDKAPGAYRDGDGADAKIEIVNADGKAQVITPAFKAQDEFKTALSGFGATDVTVNTSGTMDLNFGGQKITLKPHFDIDKNKTDDTGAKFPPGVKQVGDKFFFTNADGETQELSVVTAPAAGS